MKYSENFKTKAEDDALIEELSKHRIKCKNCGHVVLLPKQSKTICTHCGYYVFRNEREEFKQRLMEKLGKKNE